MLASNRCRCLRTDGRATTPADRHDEGYALIAVLVAVFLVLLALSIAAPTVARALRRDRELEAVHRANQYTRAIQLYYRKFGHYPGSLDQLEKSSNIRFLRQRYADPFTGKPDWRLIKVGTNKTTVKGFFGQPLAGIASTGLGSATGMSSGIGTGPGSSTGSGSFGSPTSTGFGSTSATSSTATGTDAASAATGSATGPGASTTDPTSSTSTFGGAATSTSGTGSLMGSSGGITSQSATSFTGGGAPFLGVGLPNSGSAILTVNEKTTYPDWEFLYDPRIEQLRSKVNLLGGGVGGTGSSTLGSASGLSSTSPTSTPGSSPSATSPTSSPSTSAGTTSAPQ